MRSLPLSARLAIWTVALGAVGYAVGRAALRFLPAAVPITASQVIALVVLASVLVIAMKRSSLINHHDRHNLAMPPHPMLHIGAWAVLAGAAVGWASQRLITLAPMAQFHEVAVLVVTLLAGMGQLLGEWWLLRQRRTFRPAWSDD